MPIYSLTTEKVTWTNVLPPTQEDIDFLGQQYPQFHPLHLKDCQTELEFPKLDHKDGYLFLVVQIPYWVESERSFRPAEVDIFIFHGHLVTVHRGQLHHLDEIFSELRTNEQMRSEWMGQGASPLLYRLLNALVDDCFPMVHDTGVQLRAVEQTLFQNDTRTLLRRVAEVRRNIVILRSTLNTQREIMLGLFKGNWPFIQENLDPYWQDIGEHLNQLCYTLDQDAEVISGLSETVDTLASHRIDEVVSLLTIITILTLPVTLLSTIFSMNVNIPFKEHFWVFFVVLLAGIAVTAGLIWFLRSKKWL